MTFHHDRRSRRTAASRLWAALVLGFAALAGCADGAKTPDEAFAQLARAVKSKDASALFEALDQETKWSWMTIRRSHREAYDIVLSNFPEADKARTVRRFEAGAVAESERALFGSAFDVTRWDDLARATAGSPSVTVKDTEAHVLAGGAALPFRKGPKSGRWGFAGFAAESEAQKRRAIADLEVTRKSAADYERAATRAETK